MLTYTQYLEIMRRCTLPWVIRKSLEDFNKTNKTQITVDDVEKARENFGQSSGYDNSKCSLVLCGSDDHCYCVTYVNDAVDETGKVKQRVLFNMDYYKSGLDRVLHALDANYYHWSWGENINEFVFLHAGDPIEGLGVFKEQGYVVEQGLGSYRDQSNGYIQHSAIPILEWGKQKFGNSRMTMVCDSNHTRKGYNTPEYNNEIFRIADSLIDKGYKIHQAEIAPLYVYTDVKGWGFINTHGAHLPKLFLAPLRERMLNIKARFPYVQVVGSGHWHIAMNPTKIVDTNDSTQLWYYRTGSPKFDRHSAQFGWGSDKWFTFIIHEKYGIIDTKEFAFAPHKGK